MMRSAFDVVSACASVLATTKSTPCKPGGDHVVDGVAAGAADPEHGDPRLQLPDVGNFQIDAHVCLLFARTQSIRNAAGCCRSAAGRCRGMLVGCGSIRSSRAAIVRPVRCSRPSLSGGAAYAAVRNVRDAPPADRPADRPRPRRPGPWPLPASRRCRADARARPDAPRIVRGEIRHAGQAGSTPPVRMTRPRGSAANGDAASRSRTISRISSTRGLMMWVSVARETNCGASRSLPPALRQGDHVALVQPAGQHTAIERLDSLGVVEAGVTVRGPDPCVTWLPPSAKPSACTKRPPAEHRHGRGAGADVDDRRTEVGLVVGERRQCRHIGARDHRLDVEMAALDRQHEVAAGGEVGGDEMHVDAEPLRQHAARIADAARLVDGKTDRQRMQQHAAVACIDAARCRRRARARYRGRRWSSL